MPTYKRRKTHLLERLEQRELLTATVAGIDIDSMPFPSDSAWVEVQNRQLIDSSGIDRLRLRFTEPIAATQDASLRMISPEGSFVGEIGADIVIAQNGLSAVWALPRVLDNEFVAVSQIRDAFVDADSGEAVVDEVFRLDFLAGDATKDGQVAFDDFLELSGSFGETSDDLAADFNRNGTVDFSDFLVLSRNFGVELDPGTSRQRAYDVDPVEQSIELVNDIGFESPDGVRDTSDVYRFTLHRDSTVTIEIDGVEEDTHFYLYSADRNNDGGVFNGSELLEAREYATGDFVITESLAGHVSGTEYFLQVVAARNSTNTPYRVKLQGKPVLAANLQDPGANRNDALEVDLSNRSEITGVITAGVDWDAYKFTLTTDATVSINVEGLEEDTHIYLYTDDRNEDGGVFNGSELLESFEYVAGDRVITETLAGRPSGTEYYVRMVPARNASSTSYQLGIQSAPLAAVDLQDSGDNRDDAVAVDLASNPSFTGVVTAGVDWDAFKFTLTEDTAVTINVNGLQEDTHIYLYSDDRNNDGGVFNGSELLEALEYVAGDRVITETLAGTKSGSDYFLRLVPARNATSTSYNLSMRGDPITAANLANPGAERGDALEIDLGSQPEFTGVVTAGVDWDAYKFTVNEDTVVSININGIQEETHFYVYGGDENNDGQFNSRELQERLEYVTGDRVLTTTLDATAGDSEYYLRIVPARNATSSMYQVAFSS